MEKDETKTDEKKVEESTTENTGAGDTPKEDSVVERLHKATEGMEKANQERIRINAEEKAERQLSGLAEAGVLPPPKKEDTPDEWIKKIETGELNPFEDYV